MANGETNKEVYERLARLETKVDQMADNHIPHLQAAVERNQKVLYIGIGVLGALQFVAPFIIAHLLT